MASPGTIEPLSGAPAAPARRRRSTARPIEVPGLTWGAVPWGGRPDDWPHTTRVLPWLLAGFLAMLFLVPFDSINLAINIGVDGKPDRLFVGILVLVWICVVAAAGAPSGTGLRITPIHAAIAGFVAVAFLSVALNLGVLANVNDVALALKKLALLLSYVALFLVTATTVRVSELRSYGVLIVVLGCVTALGAIYEYRTKSNLFFDWTDMLLPDAVGSLDSAVRLDTKVTGPAAHGLAVSTLISFALPWAITGIWRHGSQGRAWYYGFATLLMLTGIITSEKKSALVVPAFVLLALLVYRPKAMLRLLPLAIVAIALMQVAAPGALGTIKARFLNAQSGEDISTRGRTNDYAATKPDLARHPVLGRGYGTYDGTKYRILDNAYLQMAITVGLVGIAAFLAMLLTVFGVGTRIFRSQDPVRGPPVLAVMAGTAGFAVSGLLFDVLSFPQVPYMFLFSAGLVAVCWRPRPGKTGSERREDESEPERERSRPAAPLVVR